MKFLRCYCVVDVDAENIIANFFAVNEKHAKRIFDEAYNSTDSDIKERYVIFQHQNCTCQVAETMHDLESYYKQVFPVVEEK